MATASSTVWGRLVANKVSRDVLYMEADRALVDLLLCFLQLPLGSVLDILSVKDSGVPQLGSISNAYQSLCSLIRDAPVAPVQDASGLFYVVTDDLNILQNCSTMENLELLSKLKVTNMATLDKLEISITVDEVLLLLKCSFRSQRALNVVFGKRVESYSRATKSIESMLCWKQEVQGGRMSIPVRFLIKKYNREIVYMEVGKDFFDVLERFLNTPISWLMDKLSKGQVEMVPEVGNISNVYRSLYMLSKDSLLVSKEDIMKTTVDKARGSLSILISLLRGAASMVYTCSEMHGVSFLCNDKCPSCEENMIHELAVMNSEVLPAMGRHVYKCNKSWNRCACVSYARSKWCTSCGELTNRELPIFIAGSSNWARQPTAGFQGYVKNNLSFIVTNDLYILPASSINNIALLKKLRISRMGNIHSLVASITVNEALKLLKASFTSGEALNTVFSEQVDRSIPQASRFDCECFDLLQYWLSS